MKQSETIIKDSQVKLNHLFKQLYSYTESDSGDSFYARQQAAVSEIVQCIKNINKAQSVIDKSYTYCDGAFPILIKYVEEWNRRYIPLYEELIGIYYNEFDSYKEMLFSTDWKDIERVSLIQEQYKDMQAKTAANYYSGRSRYTLGDYYCIKDFVIGRKQEEAVDLMKRSLRIKGIRRVNDTMSRIYNVLGDVLDYSITEDTDGLTGTIIGSDSRCKITTQVHCARSRIYTYSFKITKI